MHTITTFQVVDCNKALETDAPGWRVRLHDACGRQTLSLVPEKDGPAPSTDEEAAREVVTGFFASAGVSVRFSSDGRTFWAAG